MSNKHTPGPWKRYGKYIFTAYNVIYNTARNSKICKIMMINDCAEGNANLIEAAPDMYESLKTLLYFLEGGHDKRHCPNAIEEAKAALLKASQ